MFQLDLYRNRAYFIHPPAEDTLPWSMCVCGECQIVNLRFYYYFFIFTLLIFMVIFCIIYVIVKYLFF